VKALSGCLVQSSPAMAWHTAMWFASREEIQCVQTIPAATDCLAAYRQKLPGKWLLKLDALVVKGRGGGVLGGAVPLQTSNMQCAAAEG
jgi:hypothetical protein